MTDTNSRDLIKLLINALKEECNWIDNPKHDKLIAKATVYLTQYGQEGPTDEELLQVFDTVCLSEGGTVDEIHLRGLRAVLARWGK